MSLKGSEIPEDYLPYMLCNGLTYIKIYDQPSFENYFGDGTETGSGNTAGGWDFSESGGLVTVTIPEGTIVVLVPCEFQGTLNTFNGQRGYELKTKIKLSRRTGIIGINENTTIISRYDASSFKDDLKFITTYIERQSVSSVSNTQFNITSADSYFSEGDTVVYEKSGTFYTVVAVTSTYVDVGVPVDDTGAGATYLASCVTDIFMDGWSFDGRGGVNGLGGSATGTGKSGGAFNIPYCADSVFTLQTINHKVENDGGGLWGNELSAFIQIKNVKSCQAGTVTNEGKGGGVYGFKKSKISYITYCIAYSKGGGASNCDYSDIDFIYACKALTGISNAEGGGIYACTNCNIEQFVRNYSAWRGGAGSKCDYSKINMISQNKAVDNGGAFYDSDHGEFKNIFNNSANKACLDCNNSVFLGNWEGNSANIYATNSIAHLIYDSTAKISSALETIDI